MEYSIIKVINQTEGGFLFEIAEIRSRVCTSTTNKAQISTTSETAQTTTGEIVHVIAMIELITTTNIVTMETTTKKANTTKVIVPDMTSIKPLETHQMTKRLETTKSPTNILITITQKTMEESKMYDSK